MFLANVWDVLKTLSKSAWGAVGTLSLLTGALISYIFRDRVNDDMKAALPFVCFAAVFMLSGSVMVGRKLAERYAKKNGHIAFEDREIVTYHAYPYEADSNLRKLSAFAHEEFKGNTMAADMVQFAVRTNAAIGLRLADENGNNVGFLDVYHFRDDVLEKWINGTIAEENIGEDDFEPIPDNPKPGQKLHLVVGAILVKRKPFEPSPVTLLVAIAENYIRQVCAKFDHIVLYASIFDPNDGLRLARLSGFRDHRDKADRIPHGTKHDVMIRDIRRGDLPQILGGVGGRKRIVVKFIQP